MDQDQLRKLKKPDFYAAPEAPLKDEEKRKPRKFWEYVKSIEKNRLFYPALAVFTILCVVVAKILEYVMRLPPS